ncbi:MAG: VOC family protein, partial [Pseudomonadota bacterium]
MFTGIDHVVVAVADLDTAGATYTQAGFTVVRGGKHNIGTHNALIAFADGSYIELIAFLNAVPGHPWFKALQQGGGVIDFCMRTDDLDADVAALRIWLETQRSNAETAANAKLVGGLARELIEMSHQPDAKPLALAQ